MGLYDSYSVFTFPYMTDSANSTINSPRNKMGAPPIAIRSSTLGAGAETQGQPLHLRLITQLRQRHGNVEGWRGALDEHMKPQYPVSTHASMFVDAFIFLSSN